ncbi:putative mRNA decay activator protein ZFP36L1 [Paratrimastix pyriformis]|uniref:mRNA decay activator protein ZFP36L1 n=1 Tax=Paratrimastix pyriformis TaxID=342808 RepID=A0ABQ8UUU6_9EUKA|nr:putative mRNA decay activator protein ZFP36L1 [Paratrimastix pyriformis]
MDQSTISPPTQNPSLRVFQLWKPESVNNDGSVKLVAVRAVVESTMSVEEQLASQNRHKTELCRLFMETGSCRYGDACKFAHSVHELRAVLRHPKYKTVPCAAFHSTGRCIYGNRCRFIHELSSPLSQTAPPPVVPAPPSVASKGPPAVAVVPTNTVLSEVFLHRKPATDAGSEATNPGVSRTPAEATPDPMSLASLRSVLPTPPPVNPLIAQYQRGHRHSISNCLNPTEPLNVSATPNYIRASRRMSTPNALAGAPTNLGSPPPHCTSPLALNTSVSSTHSASPYVQPAKGQHPSLPNVAETAAAAAAAASSYYRPSPQPAGATSPPPQQAGPTGMAPILQELAMPEPMRTTPTPSSLSSATTANTPVWTGLPLDDHSNSNSAPLLPAPALSPESVQAASDAFLAARALYEASYQMLMAQTAALSSRQSNPTGPLPLISQPALSNVPLTPEMEQALLQQYQQLPPNQQFQMAQAIAQMQAQQQQPVQPYVAPPPYSLWQAQQAPAPITYPGFAFSQQQQQPHSKSIGPGNVPRF